MDMALRPRLKLSSMISRYGAQALAEGGSGVAGRSSLDRSRLPESVVTPLAGFEMSGLESPFIEGFVASRSVVTPLAGFDGARLSPSPRVAAPRSRPLAGRTLPSPDAHRSQPRSAVAAIRAFPVR